MMLIMRCMSIRVKSEKETVFSGIIASTLHLLDPPKPAHSGSSGDGVIVWGLKRHVIVHQIESLGLEGGMMNIMSVIRNDGCHACYDCFDTGIA